MSVLQTVQVTARNNEVWCSNYIKRGGKRMMLVNISNDTLKLIDKLSKAKRERVSAIVRRHVRACQRNGFQPENMERVLIEAVEMVDLEDRFPESNAEDGRDWEPARSYDQYVSPKAA